MNYILLINAFWKRLIDYPIKPSSIALYGALADQNNGLGWMKSFTPDYLKLLQVVNITKNTYYDCLKELENKGYIKYELSNNRALTGKITIVFVSQFLVNEQEPKHDSACDSTHDSTSTLNKQVNIKNSKPIKREIEYDLSFVDFAFSEIFEKWLTHKKGRGEYYKTEMSLQQCYKNLLRDSNNDAAIASLIIDNAIGSNHAGFYPLKNGHGVPASKSSPGKAESTLNQFERLKIVSDTGDYAA